MLFLVLSLLLVALAIFICYESQCHLPCCRRVLLVFAHPDDETMFFSPVLNGLRLAGTTVYFLCVSTGDQDGTELGIRRKHELGKAVQLHGHSVDNLTILDYDYLRDGLFGWCRERLAKTVLRHMQVLGVDTVITFDEYGVSGHPNHISCFRALQLLYSKSLIPAGVQVFVLESVPIWRKYVIPLDAIISSYHSTFLYVSSPSAYLTAWKAMMAHPSQLLWYRYLYMAFSRFTLINTLKRIHALPRYYVSKGKKVT